MPLETQILRNGEPLPLRWGGFHAVALVCAAAWDSGEGPFEENRSQHPGYPDEPQPINPGDEFRIMTYWNIAETPLNRGGYTLKGTHRFIDVMDGEVLELLPGDELIAYRTHK